ncbi:MAG: hypothetical protein WCJ39_03845 [bacterium]
MLKKIKHAESEYNDIIQEASLQKDTILSDALEKQKAILKEGDLLNKKLNQEILEDAKKKAEEIIQQA